MIARFFATLGLLGALAMAGAVTPALAATATPLNVSASKVTVTADTYTIEQDKNLSTFTGHVVVVQPTVKIWADKAVARYGTGISDVKTFEATGHVKLQTATETATGESAVYDPKSQLLTLTGDVVVTSANGTVRGGSMVMNLATNTSTFRGTKGQRVTSVFSTQ